MTSCVLPWEYSFPPFYTLQQHEETRKRQIAVWADIVLGYNKSLKKNKLNLTSAIFNNESIGRKAEHDLIVQICEFLLEAGYLHPIVKAENEWNISWHTIDEYGDMMYAWALETGQLNSVCTLHELGAGKSDFSEISEDILLKVLHKLESHGKAEIINIDDCCGVKFF